MKQMLLIFFSILILNCSYSFAESLPALPSLPTTEEEPSASSPKEETSFFEKIKSFFGFGKSNKIENNETNKQAIDESAKKDDIDPGIEDKEIIVPSIDDIADNNSGNDVSNKREPKASAVDSENLPDEASSLSNNTQVLAIPEQSRVTELPSNTLVTPILAQNTVPKDTELKLPEGFDEEANKLPTDTSPAPVPDQTIPKMVEDKTSTVSGQTADTQLPKSSIPILSTPEQNSTTSLPNNLPVTHIPASNTSKDTELKLPEGFDEEANKLPTDASPAPVPDQAIPKMVEDKTSTAPANIPALDKNNSSDMPVAKKDGSGNVELEIPVSSAVKASVISAPVQVEQSKERVPGAAEIVKIDSNSPVSKYRKQMEQRLKGETLPVIPKEELIQNSAVNPNVSTVAKGQIDPAQQKFINDEAKVLILPNDDIILGEVTEDSKLEMMDFSTYVNIFWENYTKMIREPQREKINKFIETYDKKYNKEKYLFNKSESYDVLGEAIKSINKNNHYLLISLLNSYSILDLTSEGGNNLLHEAAAAGNYPAAKLLIMKGINLTAKNNSGKSALYLAEKYNNEYIVYLLKSAGAK